MNDRVEIDRGALRLPEDELSIQAIRSAGGVVKTYVIDETGGHVLSQIRARAFAEGFNAGVEMAMRGQAGETIPNPYETEAQDRKR